MLDVEVTPRAAVQIEAAATWWAKNRPAAPDGIRIGFEDAKALVALESESARARLWIIEPGNVRIRE